MGDQLSREIPAFESDHLWIYENFDELFKKYPDQWIGVKNHQVIASDPDLLELRNKLPDPTHMHRVYNTRAFGDDTMIIRGHFIADAPYFCSSSSIPFKPNYL